MSDEKSKSLSRISDLELPDNNWYARENSETILALEQEMHLFKRINNSSQSISNSINPSISKKIREDALLQFEVNSSRWEILMTHPEKNSVLISNEFKSLEKENENQAIKIENLESEIEKLKLLLKQSEGKVGAMQKILDRIDLMEKDIKILRDEKGLAVEKLTQTYEQLCLEKSEKENTLIKNVEITKKAQKEEEKVANCMKLVNNLLAQKDKLQKELTQVKDLLTKAEMKKDVYILEKNVEKLETLLAQEKEAKNSTKQKKTSKVLQAIKDDRDEKKSEPEKKEARSKKSDKETKKKEDVDSKKEENLKKKTPKKSKKMDI